VIYTYVASPIGALLAVGDGHAVTGLYTPGHHRTPDAAWIRDDDAFSELRRQLGEYFDGARTDFDLPLATTGTPFQQSVWHQLARLPYGRTASYAELAVRIGAPRAVRAVGAANGRNPVSIVVPCHRVVGSDGSLTGYAGGLDAKRWLLDHERAHC
jgi:methylated-DNA-[protein]-cysteine S-methyltransferase